MSDQSKIFEITIESSSHSYLVKIGVGQLQNLRSTERTFVICDARFTRLIGELGISSLVEVVANEDNKNLRTVEDLLIQLQKMGMKRGDKIVAIGGGIIQDLSTISASLFMRGVDWIYYPTTLLGMADSCIGGKSSINAGAIKNLVGNIYPPQEIIIDTDFISTLSEIDVNAGLTEAVKICFCKGSEEFDQFLNSVQQSTSIDYPSVLSQVLKTKKWFIEVDEFDKKERQLLNFGHTFGHALEVASDHAVPHGIAVAIGMKAAVVFEQQSREISEVELRLFEYVETLLAPRSHSIVGRIEIDWTLFDVAFAGDKKHKSDAYQLVLPNSGGGVRLQMIPKTEESLSRVRNSLKVALEGIVK